MIQWYSGLSNPIESLHRLHWNTELNEGNSPSEDEIFLRLNLVTDRHPVLLARKGIWFPSNFCLILTKRILHLFLSLPSTNDHLRENIFVLE